MDTAAEPALPGTGTGPPRRDAMLSDFEVSLAAVMRLLTERHTTGHLARRSGHDLPPASWVVLEHLAGEGPMRVSQIAARHGVDISSVTPRLQSLERAGLVGRERLATDARVYLISITGQGRQALDRVHAARREILARAMGGADEDRIAAATQVLAHLAQHLSSLDQG